MSPISNVILIMDKQYLSENVVMLPVLEGRSKTNPDLEGCLSQPNHAQRSSNGNQARIKCWATFDPPAKRHFNDVSLIGR